jgi:putative ABC transport system ATP-binding protein
VSSPEIQPICVADQVTKVYEGITVLDQVSLEVLPGELTVFAGQSGSGKSTLMNCIAGLDTPTTGTVLHEGVDIHAMPNRDLTRWRGENIGFVLQAANLTGGSVKENIVNPHKLIGNDLDSSWLFELVETLGITDQLDKRPNQLSGGQRQRVAIARALAHQPRIVFADEPTAALDSENRHAVYGLFKNLVDTSGVTVVMVAHDDVATSTDYADKVVKLADGKVKNPSLFNY